MPRAIRGRENYVRHMKDAYAKIPNWNFPILHMYGDEHAVIAKLDGAGRFTGDHRGKKIEGAPLRLASVYVFDLRDGQIYSR